MPEDFQEIEVDGVGRFQVPSNYNDAQIKQHISNLRSTKPEIFGGQAALSAQEQAAGARVASLPSTMFALHPWVSPTFNNRPDLLPPQAPPTPSQKFAARLKANPNLRGPIPKDLADLERQADAGGYGSDKNPIVGAIGTGSAQWNPPYDPGDSTLSKAWQTLTTPVPDLFYGKGTTGNAITYATSLGRFETSGEAHQHYDTAPDLPMSVRALGGMAADMGEKGAGPFINPLAILTLGAGKGLGAAGSRVQRTKAALEDSLNLSNAAKQSGASSDVLAQSLQDVTQARTSLQQAERVFGLSRGTAGLTSAGFAAQGGSQTVEGVQQYRNAKIPIQRQEAIESILSGAGQAMLGGTGVAHSMTPLERISRAPLRPEIPLAPEGNFSQSAASKFNNLKAEVKQRQETPALPEASQTPPEKNFVDQTVGSVESSKADTDFFHQAKKELGDGASISQMAQKAQELKIQVLRPNQVERNSAAKLIKAQRSLNVESRAQWDERYGYQGLEDTSKSLDRQLVQDSLKGLQAIRAGSIYKPIQVIEGKTEASMETPTDLSKLSPEDRHDWINQNVQLRIDATSLEDARAKAQTMFGGHLSAGKQEVISYLDKDGKPSFGLKLDYSNPKAPPSSAFTKEETPIFGRIQSLESDFTQKTMGKHGEFLNDLWKKVEETLPKDTPRAGKLSLYEKGLSQAVSAVKKGDLQGLYKSFDVVTQKGEEGFIGPRAARVDPAEASRLSALHVDTQLSKWESYPDYALAGKKIQKSLSDPSFRNAVYGANAPHLEARYEALSERAGLAKSNNPIITLGKTLQGVDLTSGDVARGIFREGLAAKARGAAIRTKQLDSYVKSWDSRPLSDSLQLIDSIEHGDIQSIPNPTDRAMAQQLRAMLDAKRDEVIALGTGKLEQFNANYFPHMWKFGLGDLAKQIMSGRRPLAGGQGFLRARTYDTFSEGIQAGMEPVTYNPVKMSLLKMHEMDRYITAHTAFNELKSKGLVVSLSSRDVPVGWARINDQIFNPKPFAVDGATSADAPRVMMTKAYYAPADVARPINNYLSPGLRGNALFDTISSYNNVLNQFNLSLSLFHGVETGINAAVSKSALGLGQIQQGKLLTGVKNILVGPVEPLAAYLRGNKLLQEYLDPGSYAKMSKEAIALEMAGGRISMPMEWKNQATEAFRSAWKEAASAPNLSLKQAGKVGLGVYRTLGVALEKASVPIMEYYVPRVKLGVFADMAKDVLDRVGPNVSHEVLRHELGKAWDSVDNRFGQVVYDNWFWNRTFKDIGHLAVRSVGWNLGTAQEVGAVWDVKTQLQTGFKGGLTRKQLYTLSLLGYTAMMGATLSHLYGQQPDELTYMGYAKTGKKNPDGSDERIFVKTYINDIYSFYHAPGQTASNKLAPIWSQVSQLYNNADYFGRQIHPIHASTTDALTDPDSYTSTGKYLLKSTFPFSVTNMQQRMASGESVWQAASSSMAILQAPKWVGQTKAQSLAYELYRTKLPRGPGDPDVADRIQRYHQLATGYSAGNFSDKDVEKAFQGGEITPKQFDSILGSSDKNFQDSDGKLSILLRHTKVLPAHEFIRVFEAGTPQEKRDLELQLLQKTSTLLENYPEGEANKLLVRFDKAYKSIPR